LTLTSVSTGIEELPEEGARAQGRWSDIKLALETRVNRIRLKFN